MRPLLLHKDGILALPQVFMAGVIKRFGKAAKLQIPNQFDRSIHDKKSEV